MADLNTEITLPNLNINNHLPENFSPQSKVWVYQSSRLLTISEALDIEKQLIDFIANWKSHGAPVTGYANLFFGQFFVIMADDTNDRICGRSINQSVVLMKEIAEKYQIDLFNRLTLGFWIKEKVELLPMSQLSYAIKNEFITRQTPFFNNAVANKADLENNWIKSAGDTWLNSYFSKG